MALEEARAAGRDGGFDVLSVGLMSYFAFLIALGSCVVGLLYFGYAECEVTARIERAAELESLAKY